MVSIKTMPITKARINLGAVVKRVHAGERIILEKGGIPVATIVNSQWLEDLEDAMDLARLRVEQAGEVGEDAEVVLKRYGL